MGATLKRLALAATVVVLVLMAPGSVARALPGEVDGVVRLFVEPASGQRVTVVTPAVSGHAQLLPALGATVDWNADVVSGATPRTYGRPDAVSQATRFSDLRNAFGVKLDGTGTVGAAAVRVGGSLGYRYSFENDYRSHVLEAGAHVDLRERTTTLALLYAHNFDSVCDLDNGALPTLERQPLGTSAGCFSGHAGLVEEALAADAAELSLTQVMTRRLVAALALAGEHLDGFQSNPYRRVRLLEGQIEAQESHPRQRDRAALSLRARYATDAGALGLDLRGYVDSWSVRSLTVEGSFTRAFLDGKLVLRLRARGYVQTRASFYRDAGELDSYEHAGAVGRYFTGDRELAPLGDLTGGARLAWRLASWHFLDGLEAALRLDATKVFALSPEPPSAERTRGIVDALVAGLSLSARF